MTRATQTISILVALASVYLALFLGYIPVAPKVQNEVLPYLPFWAIVSFGAYLLFKLGYGVMTFNDVPEAHKELMVQIEQAKIELRAKGVPVDD